MQPAPIPLFEQERLYALHGLHLLDTDPEERFDRITQEAVTRFDVPISTIALLDEDRERFKSGCGVDTKEGARNISFCGHALVSEVMTIVEDTLKDERFSDNPMVTEHPFIRFYAGKALYEYASKLPVGVFCIKDTKPRKMSAQDIDDFLDLAHRAEEEINRVPSE